MPVTSVTVVIPTLQADSMLAGCVRSLERQTFRDFEVVVVDNSGQQLVRRQNINGISRLIENPVNAGFGRAINQAAEGSNAAYVATLNDDAVAHPDWLAALVAEMGSDPRLGMCASQVRLGSGELIDSAGMLACGDGSSKQRGHGRPVNEFSHSEAALIPSGSAALYRRELFDQLGGFDEGFFLYCEDTDLGLRARWAGWECAYVPGAIVEHSYSHSAGRASPLKAYYVERNRIAVAMKNYPLSMLLGAPFITLARYFWHAVSLVAGRGVAGQFHSNSNGILLPWFVLKAHFAALVRLPELLRQRRRIRQSARITARQFRDLVRRHYISARQVAAQ